MSNSDVASALDRFAPGLPGTGIKFTFTNAASAEQPIPFHDPQPVGGFSVQQGCVYISVKVTADCHLAFGPDGMGAPTNADPLFQAADSWQDMILLANQVNFRVKGDVAGGDIYIWANGKPS